MLRVEDGGEELPGAIEKRMDISIKKQKIHQAFGLVDLIWVKVLSEEERDFVSC